MACHRDSPAIGQRYNIMFGRFSRVPRHPRRMSDERSSARSVPGPTGRPGRLWPSPPRHVRPRRDDPVPEISISSFLPVTDELVSPYAVRLRGPPKRSYRPTFVCDLHAFPLRPRGPRGWTGDIYVFDCGGAAV